MIPFDYQPRTRIVFGPDKIDSLGALAGAAAAQGPVTEEAEEAEESDETEDGEEEDDVLEELDSSANATGSIRATVESAVARAKVFFIRPP